MSTRQPVSATATGPPGPVVAGRWAGPHGHRGARTGLLVTAGLASLGGGAVAVPWARLPVIGLVALVALVPLLGRLAGGAAWCLLPLGSIAVLLVDTSARSLAPGPARYIATLVVLATIVMVGVRRDPRSRALRSVAAVLFAYGLLGTLYGRLFLGTTNGALPLIGPMVIVCLPPVRNWSVVPRWRCGLRVLSAVCSLFAVGSGLSRLGVLPAAQVDVLNHEKAYLVVLGVTAALAARDRLLVPLSLAAAVFAFVAYPAATYVVAAGIAAGTVALARWAPEALSRASLAVAAIVGTLIAVLKIDDLIKFFDAYFRLVGKTDNGDTRAALYQAALDRLHSPVLSQLFTGDITLVGRLAGTDVVLPVHNDYLSLALGGGVVASALMLGIFLLANGLALRTLRTLRRPVDAWQRRTVVVLLAAVNGAAVSAFANPIFMNPGASAVTFAVLAALMAACRLPDPVAAEPGGSVGREPVPTRAATRREGGRQRSTPAGEWGSS